MQKSMSAGDFLKMMQEQKEQDNNIIYLLEVHEEGEQFFYEFNNYTHAKEQYNREEKALLWECNIPRKERYLKEYK